MPKRSRRSQSETLALVLSLTKRSPVTSQVVASELGVSGNRARQILDALRDDDHLEIVGKTQGGRGKPASIYGLPGTKVTTAAVARLSGRTSVGTRGAATAMDVDAPAGRSAIDALLDAIATRGLEVVGPGGLTFTVRFATGGAGLVPSDRVKRKYTRRKPKTVPAVKKTAAIKAPVVAAKKPFKKKVAGKPIKTTASSTPKAAMPRLAAAKPPKVAPKVPRAPVKKPAPVKTMKKKNSAPIKKATGPKAGLPKGPKLELITPKTKSDADAAETVKTATTPEGTPPAPSGGV